MSTTTLDFQSFADFRQRFSGEILEPGDAGYEVASVAYMSIGSPALVARPATPDDVAEAVRYAGGQELLLSVRGGGHHGSGVATNEGGLVIDLSALDGIEVLDGGLVRVGGGARWGDVAKALQPHDLALTSGDTTTVGVGGLTLGGGVGWMVRQYGLALDSLVAAEVVTAAGDIVHASEEDEPELFWALRGGGGNFGVVTTFTFQAHPLRGVHSGAIQFGEDDLEGHITAWRDVMRVAPEELNSTFVTFPSFGEDMPGGTSILVCYAGDDEQAAATAIAPLLAIKGVVSGDIQGKAYADVLDEAHPPGGPITIVDNNAFAADLSDEAIGTLAAVHRGLGGAVLMLRYLRGAFNRVAPDATAFAWRDSEVLIVSAAFLPPDAVEADKQRVHDLWAATDPFTAGSYGNFLSRVDESAIAAIYPPDTRARLAAAKHHYDPFNLFCRNHNIAPRRLAEN
ncbi:MAG: FAD-linked oxidase [Microbacteriaceae bacterium]|nr:FAD-linked oxidase [Microbacteriaceae bacterium]